MSTPISAREIGIAIIENKVKLSLVEFVKVDKKMEETIVAGADFLSIPK